MEIDRPDWQGGQPAETPAEPEKPTFTLAELQEFVPEPEAGEPTDAALDDEDRQTIAGMRAAGMSDEEIARARGIDTDKVPPAEPEAPDLADVERELRGIDRRRKEDFAAYRRDEAMQQRERELLTERERLRAERATAAPASGELEAIDRELAEINQTLRTDRRRYHAEGLDKRQLELLRAKERIESGAGGDGLPDAVRDGWAAAGGIQHHLAIAQGRTDVAMRALNSGERAALTGSFDTLPGDVADVIVEHLGSEPVKRIADAATMAALAEAGHGEGLSAQEVGTAQSAVASMMKSMSPAARADAEAWAASLSPAEKRAAIRALAGGR